MFESPSFRMVILEACLFLVLSRAASPMTLLFNLPLRSLSSSLRTLFSCAISKRRITSKAI